LPDPYKPPKPKPPQPRDERDDGLNPIISQNYEPIDLIESYCSDAASGLYCIANATQDVATLIDLNGAAAEWNLILLGCSFGGPGGCVAGWKAGMKLWNAPIFGPFSANYIEGRFSFASLVFTMAADFEDGGNGFLGLEESSATAFVTFSLGQMSPDPIVDLAIDGYASGYNHGIFNDVITIINGGSIFK